MITAIAIILVIGSLIFFHELGHFLMARAFGMGVPTFSLGFGPKLISHTWGKTEYKLSLIPLGGYVHILGEEEEDLPEGFTAEECLNNRPAWQKLLVVAAGPAANFLLAIIICWGLAYYSGVAEILPKLGEIVKDSPAEQAGLASGDLILKANGAELKDWGQMSSAIELSNGAPLIFSIARNNEILTKTVTPTFSARKNIFGEDEKVWLIGIRSSGEHNILDLGFFESAKVGTERAWQMLVLTWSGLAKLVQRSVPLDQVGGPIMIAQLIGEQTSAGLINVLLLTALISINLAVFNLLPIPVLDGGQILFYLYEWIVKRPVSVGFRETTMKLGWVFVIFLMILATSNDIWRILKEYTFFGG